MQLTNQDLVLVTGATGLVGGHVVERLTTLGIPSRALVRASADTSLLTEWGAELITGDLSDACSLREAAKDATVVVHCAAKVGDWGPVDSYRAVNVEGTRSLLEASLAGGSLKRFVHISSLGVYQARDHYGTDETERPNASGIDGYTLTKVESEELVRKYIDEQKLPGVVLRPGFIYGPRDRTVLPRILEKLRTSKFKFLGSTDKLMNNTYVGNLVDAVLLSIERDDVLGEVFNIRDGRAVSKMEFIDTIAKAAGLATPTAVVPLPVARGLAKVLETTWRLLGKQEAPLVSQAKIKFLGLNLDYSIDKAKCELGYAPVVDFKDGMREAVKSLDRSPRDVSNAERKAA